MDIPEDVWKAARDVELRMYLEVDEEGVPYIPRDGLEEIARAIMAERERTQKAERERCADFAKKRVDAVSEADKPSDEFRGYKMAATCIYIDILSEDEE